jgi:pheromone shutdown protein TraB
VVVLEAPNASGGTARVYVMGVSHVSKIQAQQVKTLIRAVRPEVVCVELCKERVGLLVDDRMEAQTTNLWHVRKVGGAATRTARTARTHVRTYNTHTLQCATPASR